MTWPQSDDATGHTILILCVYVHDDSRLTLDGCKENLVKRGVWTRPSVVLDSHAGRGSGNAGCLATQYAFREQPA
jgi:hypothetical protein